VKQEKRGERAKYKFTYYRHPHVCHLIRNIHQWLYGWTMNMSTKMWLIWYYIKLFGYLMILEAKKWYCQIVIKHGKQKWRQNMPNMMPNIMHNFFFAILNKNRITWNRKLWFLMKVILIFTHWIFINAGCRQGIYDKKSKFDDTVCMLHIVIFWKIKFYHMLPNKYYIPIDLKTY